MRIERRADQAVDTLTLELADFALYSEFDFSTLPTGERIQVGTASGEPRVNGVTVGTAVLTSAGATFGADGVTADDLLLILASTVAADIGAWPITAIGATTLAVGAHTFGTATGVSFTVLKNQGRFFIEKPDVIESKDMIAIPSLWGRNGLARLLDPFAERLTRTWTKNTTLFGIIDELVGNAGMDPAAVAIDINDFTIPANIYSVSGQYPLQVIIDLVSKTNGYARSTRDGDLWIQKQLFHLDGLPVALALDESNIADQVSERIEYPEFGNRILVRTQLSSAGQEYQIRLELDTPCIRGTSTAVTAVLAIVTDGAGNPAGDGTPVRFSIDNPLLGQFFPVIALTGEWPVIGELQQASDLLSVSTDYPIREVLGVYLENDANRALNYFVGAIHESPVQGTTITLGRELPFTDSRVVVDYIAAGVARSSLAAVAGAAEGKTEVHAAIGKIRDTQEFCINNQLNVSISLHATKTEYNLCKNEQAMVSKLTAQVKIDGLPANGAMVQWRRRGDPGGTVTPKWSALKNLTIEEVVTSRNNFTVNVQNEISKVLGVWVGATVEEAGYTDYYNTQQDRTRSFEGREITLGTNLPKAQMAVVVRYVSFATAQAEYSGPSEIGEDEITAVIADGTSTPAQDSLVITTINDCTGDSLGGSGGGQRDPGGEKNCSNSTPSGSRCASVTYPNAVHQTVEECICAVETGGSGCPTTAQGCEDFCKAAVAKYGLDPLSCDQKPTPAAVDKLEKQLGTSIPTNQEAAYASCAETCKGDPDCISPCVAAHTDATVDRCKQKCLDHGLVLTPTSGAMNCGSGNNFSVKGGTAPYTWSASRGTLTTSGDKNQSARLAGPGTASGVAGVAYVKYGGDCGMSPVSPTCQEGGSPAPGIRVNVETRGCNDQVLSACAVVATPGRPPLGNCATHPVAVGSGACASVTICHDGGDSTGTADRCGYHTCDARSLAMVGAGCNPCGLSMAGTTMVTVSDSAGQSATAVITG